MKVFFLLLFGLSSSITHAQEDHPSNQLIDGWIYNHTVTPAANADPRGSIRCIGPYPGDIIDLEPDRSAIEGRLRSALEFCADPEYGGRLGELWGDTAIAGTACAYFLDPPRVVVSKKWSSKRYDIDWKRWHYCQMKCACLGPAPTKEVAAEVAISNDKLTSLINTGQMLGNFVLNRYHLFMYGDEFKAVDGVEVATKHPIPLYQSVNGLGREVSPRADITRSVIVSGVYWNQLVCRQALPPWPLPLERNYRKLHDLCSVNFLNGNPDGNIGGFCISPYQNLVRFSNAFAHPLLSLEDRDLLARLVGGGARTVSATAVLAIRFWCLANCVCMTPNPQTRRRAKFSNKTPWGTLSFENKKWTLVNKEVEEPYSWNLVVNNKVSGDADMAMTTPDCLPLAPGSPWCATPPPLAIISRLTGTSELISALKGPSSSSHPSCGASCSGPAECPPTEGAHSCKCVANSKSIVTSQSYDPIFGNILKHTFKASCLALGANLIANDAVKTSGRGKRKSKREAITGQQEGLERQGSLCVCNATYISAGCCGSQDGWIRQDEESQGILRGIR